MAKMKNETHYKILIVGGGQCRNYGCSPSPA